MEEKTSELGQVEQQKALARLNELLELCNKAGKPNPQAHEELQSLIRTTPACKMTLQRQHSMYVIALRGMIEHDKASDTWKEVQYVKCKQLKEELGFDTANRLEQLAIEHIVLCYINYHQTATTHAGNLLREHSREAGIYWEKRLNEASRRYTRALEVLTKMRRMKLVIQVNNGENQIINN